MEIEFDPAKNLENLSKHGIRLADFDGFDDGWSVTIPDTRFDYGEDRYRTFGRINGLGYMIAFTLRNGAIRLISLRRAHDEELRRYDQSAG